MDREAYIDKVLEHLPSELEQREDIAMEIRSTIEERIASGQKLYQVLDQLGTPLELAESYMQDMPMESASFGARVVAKLIDLSFPVVMMIVFMGWQINSIKSSVRSHAGGPFVFVATFLLIGLLFQSLLMVYPALAEWHFERTFGKQIMGLRVARESGVRISLGQSFLRQLPWLIHVVWLVDAMFPLFTDKQQRGAEILSHTRTIVRRQA